MEKKLKLIIFGATGSLGRQVTEQALAEGHHVTAFARRPARLKLQHPRLSRISGDVLDAGTVASALDGQDAVLITLGAGHKGALRAPGTRNIVKAMQARGLRRLICLSTLGAGDSRPLLTAFWKYLMFGLLLRKAYADHQEQEAIVTASGLDWTLVRPAAFTDGPATGTYRHGFPSTEKNLKLKISRADIADFMVRQVTGEAYLLGTPALSY